MPAWLQILSTGAEVAGTQYMEDTNRRRGLNCSLLRMVLTVAFGRLIGFITGHKLGFVSELELDDIFTFNTLFIYTGSR